MINLSCFNDTNPDSPHRALLDLIPVGREHALSIRYLASALHIEELDLYRLIEDARSKGNYISENERGVFIPDTVSDLEEYVNRSLASILTAVEAVNPSYYILRGEKLMLKHEKVGAHDK